MSALVLELKQHDTKPWLVVQLRDLVGTPEEKPLNLEEEGIKKVMFVMRKEGASGSPKVRGEAEMTDKALGVVTYKWLLADTSEAATFEGEFETEDEEGGIESVPRKGTIKIIINPDLG